jgi:hypothetical protein
VAGEPLRMHFDLRRREFRCSFRHDPKVSACTEIFIPTYQYPAGIIVEVSDGKHAYDREAQRLSYWHDADRDVHTVTVRPQGS